MPIQENTGYRGKQLIIGFMKDLNTTTMVASKAYDISVIATNFVANNTPQSEEVVSPFNGGQQSRDNTGSAKYDGTLDVNLTTGFLPILISGAVGRGTQVDLVAPAWAATTVHQEGDIVKLSGGKYLVAQRVYGDATTGAAEPSIVGLSDYDDLPIDGADASNGVVWKLRDVLKSSTGHETRFCQEKLFIIERAAEGCGSSNAFDTVALNVELTTFSIAKTDGTIGQQQSIPYMATSVRRSSESKYSDITFADETTDVKKIREEAYKADFITYRVDGAKYGTVLNTSLNYSRDTKVTDGAEPYEQIVTTSKLTLNGDTTLQLDPTEYEVVLKSSEKAVTFTYNAGDGESMLITMPKVVFDKPEIVVQGDEPRMLKVMQKPIGNDGQAMAIISIVTSTVI